jgi:hypothetical protein
MALELITGGCQDLLFMSKRLLLGSNRVRRTRFYCVGTGKSGTHSIANMFSKNVRALHEAQALAVMERIMKWREGRINDQEMAAWLHQPGSGTGAGSGFVHAQLQLLDLLLREFSDALYLLTIRDCYSWLNSLINHRIRFKGKANPTRLKWREWRFRTNHPVVHAPEERVLKENDLSTLDTHFAHWASRNGEALAKIPASRLLIVRTDQITQKAFEIADFARLPRRAVRLHHTHSFRNPVRQELIRQVDRAFLERKVEHHCRPLMTGFFPEIQSLDDAKL